MRDRFLRICGRLMMETSLSTPEQVRERLIAAARDLGVDRLGIARVQTVESDRERLLEWLTKGYHAGMSWISRDPDKRTQIDRVLPGARSVISVAINHSTDVSSCDDCGALKVARFAWGEDYHRVVGRKLKVLTDLLDHW